MFNPLRITRLLLGAYAIFSLAFILMPAGHVALAAWALLAQLLTGLAGVTLAILKGLRVQEVLGVSLRLPTLPKGGRVLTLGLVAIATFLFLPPLIRLVYPGFGGFAPDTLNAYTLGAAQYFLALTMAYAGWRLLFPGLYAYAAETMEGKLLESITTELLALFTSKANPVAELAAAFGKSYEEFNAAINDALGGQFERLKEFGIRITTPADSMLQVEYSNAGFKHSLHIGTDSKSLGDAILRIANQYAQGTSSPFTSLAEIAERRKIATFQFTVRCVRFMFSISPFVFFFVQANAALTAALTAVPAAAPAL